MRARDLGFSDPCSLCVRQIQIGFQGQGPTANIGSAVTNEENFPVIPGPLYEISGRDRSSAEGYTRYFKCRRCGCRWWFFDWVCTGTIDYGQESDDGLYHSRGGLVDDKKHGSQSYYLYGDRRGDPLVLGETWEYGRLVAWNDFRAARPDVPAKRSRRRSWRAANVVLNDRVPLGYSLNHLHVRVPRDLKDPATRLFPSACLVQRDRPTPASSAAQVTICLEKRISASPDARLLKNLRMNLPNWPEEMRLAYAGMWELGRKQCRRAKACVQLALRLNRRCILARQALRLLGVKKGSPLLIR